MKAVRNIALAAAAGLALAVPAAVAADAQKAPGAKEKREHHHGMRHQMRGKHAQDCAGMQRGQRGEEHRHE